MEWAYDCSKFSGYWWWKSEWNIVPGSDRVCRVNPVFCIQRNQQSDRPKRTLVSPLKSWNQGLHSSIKAATVIRRYRGMLASGAWIAGHRARHRLESVVRNYKRNPHRSPSIGYSVLAVVCCRSVCGPADFWAGGARWAHLGELFELEFDQARGPCRHIGATEYQSGVMT